MPKFTGTQGLRDGWTEENMKRAIAAVLSSKMSLGETSNQFNVPKSSLRDKVSPLKKGKVANLLGKLGRLEPTFSVEHEMQLVEHMKDLDNRFMPLTRKEFLKLVYDLAESLGLDQC